MSRLQPLDRALDWFPRHAGWVLIATLAVTAGAVHLIVDVRTGAPRLAMDASSDRLLPEDDPGRRFLEQTQRVFGKDETLLIAHASDDVFTAESLARVDAITRAVAQLEGVERVLSITNAVGIRARDGDVEIGPFVSGIPDDPAALDALRSELRDDPLVGSSLVSADERVTAILVYFLPMSHREFAERGLDEAIVALAEAERGHGEVWITGGPHVRRATARVLIGETVGLSLGILAVLAIVLALAFRTLRGVVLPLLTVVIAILWTLGAVALVGRPLNAVTALVPPLLTALGLSYAIHVVASWYDVLRADPERPGREIVAEATREVALPVGLTGLTTAAGLGSLLLSPLVAVREFGLFTVLGVLSVMIVSLTFTPALLAVLGTPRRVPDAARGGGFDRFSLRMARFDVANRRWIFLVSAGVFAVALFGASQLRVGTQQVAKFPADAPVRVHFENVNEALGGANPLYVVVSSDAPDAWKEPENLRALASLQEWLVAQPEVGGALSVVDFLSLLNQGFQGGGEEHRTVPASRRLVSQLLFFGASEELDRFVGPDYQMASIHVRARVIDSEDVGRLAARIDARLAELPGHLEGRVTGTAVVLAGALEDVVRGQTRSLLFAFGVIYLILSALFVSLRIGLLALIPNALPVAAYFGALGWLGVRLDPGSSLVAPMVLGIAVDDTIHYFARFIADCRRTADEEGATASALRAVGRPVTVTTLALCAGFLVLTTSDLRTTSELGALAAFALVAAWATDYVLTPALCSGMRIATLWDLLSLDLGAEPHKEIRLLHGLRAGQARMVALLASVVPVRAGERLFGAGEPGDAVYAVVEGRLQASVGGADGRVVLAELGRGDVVGEIGHLHLARSADVDALEDARLLRLTDGAMARLVRRSPRIAAVMYRNLSGLASERLARAAADLGGAAQAVEVSASGPVSASGHALAAAFFDDRDRGDAQAVSPDTLGPGASMLREVGLPPDAVMAVALLPLAEVAWSDGSVEPRERQALLDAAQAVGMDGDGAAIERLEHFLAERPSRELMRLWEDTVREVCRVLSVEGRLRLERELMGGAHRLAQAAGGFLGLASVSRHEDEALTRLAQAFERDGG